MRKKRIERKSQPGKKSRKANQPKKQSATRTVKQEPEKSSAKKKRPLKTRSLPPCPACGRERGTVDEEHPDYNARDSWCWECRSRRGKVAELDVALKCAEKYDDQPFIVERFPVWRSMRDRGREWFGRDLKDVDVLDRIIDWCIAQHGGDVNSVLGMKLVELANLLKNSADGQQTGGQETIPDPPVDCIESVCEKLTPQQERIVRFLRYKTHAVTWLTVGEIERAFRDKSPSYDTIFQALKRLKQRLATHYRIGQCSLEIFKSKRKVRLHANTEKDK